MIWANITKFGKNLIPPQNLWAGTPMGRRQLNYIRYNMYKKNCAWSPHQLCKKRVIIVFNVHIVIILQERHYSFGKSSIFACNYVKSLALSVQNTVYQKLIGLNRSVVNIF